MKNKRLEHYFYLSFVISSLLWGFEFWANDDFFTKGLFTSLFLVGSFKIWTLISSLKNDLKFFSIIFLFQGICLLGSSFEFKESFPFFLSLVPLLGGLYFLRENLEKIFMLSAFVVSIFIFKLVYKYVPFGYVESMAFFMTLSWISGVLFLVSDKKTEKENEKYLLHDLLNHTHGISLFLENRQNKGLSAKETSNISRELGSLQDILENHFLGGSNSEKNVLKLSEVLGQVKSLCEEFLSGIKFDVKTNGDFVEGQISFNEFLRSLGNVLKNVAESNSSYCEILIENQDNGISIIVKNTFSRNIKKLGSGIGLKSTQELLEKVGGLFCFYTHENLWVSRIYLPYLNHRKAAA